jgi:hypothetical protein
MLTRLDLQVKSIYFVELHSQSSWPVHGDDHPNKANCSIDNVASNVVDFLSTQDG